MGWELITGDYLSGVIYCCFGIYPVSGYGKTIERLTLNISRVINNYYRKPMKHLNYFTAIAVTLLLGLFSSCTPKDQPMEQEEATLTLSALAVTIPNAGGEAQPITVTTNQTKWNAISNVEWIKTTVSGNNLTIVASPNASGADRAAEVLVVAGSTSEKVSVIQSAADVVLEVSPTNIVVTNAGDTKLISIRSNSGAWSLEVDEASSAWLKKTEFKDFIQLDIAPNDGEAREAKLYAKSGTTQKEIIVQQAGKGGSKFILPYLVSNAQRYDLLSYEQRQGSFLIIYSAPTPPLPDWGIEASGEIFAFATSSPFFHTSLYNFNYDTRLMEVVSFESASATAEIVKEGFVDFLKENGFDDAAYDAASKKVTGKNAENGYSVTMSDTGDGFAIVSFTAPGPKQPKEFKTFGQFPYDNSNMLNDVQYTAAKVKELEAADNSKLINETPDTSAKGYTRNIQFELDPSKRPLHTRLYFFDNKKKDAEGKPQNNVNELNVMWSDLNLGAWEYKDGVYFITEEFKTLIKNEGFEFYTSQSGIDFYYNAAKQMMIAPRGMKVAAINGGQPVFSITYFKFEVQNSASLSEKLNALNNLAERVAAHDEALRRR